LLVSQAEPAGPVKKVLKLTLVMGAPVALS
jgi:hypothetical protein